MVSEHTKKRKIRRGRCPHRPACAVPGACHASGGPISCPVKKWGKETAGGKIPISSPRTPYLKRGKGSVPLPIPPAQKTATRCHRKSAQNRSSNTQLSRILFAGSFGKNLRYSANIRIHGAVSDFMCSKCPIVFHNKACNLFVCVK